MNEERDLKPCPFCGGEAAYGHSIVRTHVSDPLVMDVVEYDHVNCMRCGAGTHQHGFGTRSEAARHWNMRTGN